MAWTISCMLTVVLCQTSSYFTVKPLPIVNDDFHEHYQMIGFLQYQLPICHYRAISPPPLCRAIRTKRYTV